MRRVDDLPQKEVAARLRISQRTIEKHLMKGMKLLANAMSQSEPGSSRHPGSLTVRASVE